MAPTLKTAEEIEKMRVAGAISANVLDQVAGMVQVGVSTADLDRACHQAIVAAGGVPAPLNYRPAGSVRPYPCATCISINHQVCHGIPSPTRLLKNGDILNIDITVDKDGYFGDTSRMFFVGKPSIAAERLCRIARECLERGIESARPGATLGDIGHAIQSHAEKHHYNVVRDFCGHGIGRSFHEEPQVLHFGAPGTGIDLQPGMTFTIEPMINQGKAAVKLLSDGWTVVTKDRKLSAQWEHTVAITETGSDILTHPMAVAAAQG